MPRSRGRKKAKFKTNIDSKTRKLDTPPKEETQLTLLARVRRTWWFRSAKWIFGVVLVAAGGVATLDTLLGGRIWPTAPSFVPGYPSSGFAWDVPFTVSNKSALFPVNHLVIKCWIHSIQSKKGGSFREFTVGIAGENSLASLQSAPYTCPFSTIFPNLTLEPDDKITEAIIEFGSEYESRVPFSKNRDPVFSGPFTLNTKTTPPQWVAGRPLR